MAERQISIRFINAVPRTISVDALKAELLETVQMQLNNSTSGLVVGFDLVDEEDRLSIQLRANAKSDLDIIRLFIIWMRGSSLQIT